MRPIKRTTNQKHREGFFQATSKELHNLKDIKDMKELLAQSYFGGNNQLSNSDDDGSSDDDDYSDGEDDSTTDDSSSESERLGNESDESDNCILEDNNFDQIVESIEQKIFTLPENTIIYPGHGKTTTVSWEKEHNTYM